MISAQLGTEFEIPKYDEIKKVYSIWVCMNAPQYIGNAISEYKLEKKDLIPGIPDKRKEYDKLSVVMVCLNAQKETNDAFLRMMKTLLDVEMPEKEKKERLQRDYEIQMENGLGKELSLMCNLSDAVEEKGIKKGIEQGIEKGIEQGIEKGKELGKEEGKELGKLELLFSLVHDDVLSSKAAAERAGMPEKEFLGLMSQKEKE